MKRKLVLQGKTSLSVVLPKKWTERHKLDKGDDVNLIEDKGNIIISSKIKQETKKGVLDTNKLGHFNKNYINAMYKVGYDEIKILTPSLKTFDQIQKRVSWMIGYEIFDKDKNSCTIKAVSKEAAEEFDALFRKSLLITLELADAVYNNINNPEELKNARSLEQANNKFTELCARILHKFNYKNQDLTLFIYVINREIERIADRYKYIADFMLENSELRLSKETMLLFEKTNDYLRIFYNLFYKFDKISAKKYNDNRYILIEESDKIINKVTNKNPKELIVIAYLKELIQLVYEMHNPYMSMIL